MKVYDVAVIGGGAAGMACALKLADGGKSLKIAIIEQNPRLGKKLAATGNGQGNISNSDMTASHYFGGGAAVAASIACKDAYAGAKLFDCLFTADTSGRIYPAGRQASALTDNLAFKLNKSGVEVVTDRVTDISEGFEIALASGKTIAADRVVLCVGGKAQKQFGTDGSSYALALKFGHTLTKLYPSLVQLKTETEHIRTLKGIRADCSVTAIADKKPLKTVRGDVIFTEYGVSGNAIFSVSPYVTDRQGAVISLEFLPDIPAETILSNIEARKNNGCADSELLSGTLHNQLGRAVIRRACGDAKEIVKVLKNFTLPVNGTLGFDYAQVTRGGINMKDVGNNLESKLVKNLYFAGEVLDVDGDCGGYNLQWAFTGGMTVAEDILNKL